MKLKKQITTHEEFDEVRYVSEIDIIKPNNAHRIKNVYLTYVGNGHICTTCPSSIAHALRKVKQAFPESYLDALETELDAEFSVQFYKKMNDLGIKPPTQQDESIEETGETEW